MNVTSKQAVEKQSSMLRQAQHERKIRNDFHIRSVRPEAFES